jgi:ERCC4-type nuclease
LEIVVDSREKLMQETLSKKGIPFRVEALPAGDFIAGDAVVERKNIVDLMSSVVSGRLWEQLKNLKQVEGAKPLLVVEGTVTELRKFTQFDVNAYLGVVASVVLDWQIPVIQTESPAETAKLLELITKREKKTPQIRFKKPSENLDEIAEYIIAGFPGIGTVKAKWILKNFRSIRNFVENAKYLHLVPGFSEKTRDEILRILEHEYGKTEKTID